MLFYSALDFAPMALMRHYIAAFISFNITLFCAGPARALHQFTAYVGSYANEYFGTLEVSVQDNHCSCSFASRTLPHPLLRDVSCVLGLVSKGASPSLTDPKLPAGTAGLGHSK